MELTISNNGVGNETSGCSHPKSCFCHETLVSVESETFQKEPFAKTISLGLYVFALL